MSDTRHSRLQIVPLPDTPGLQVIGEIDLSTRDIWQCALDSATATDAPTRLDLSQLAFIDARGTAMLIAAAQNQPGTTTLMLIRPPSVLLRMLPLLHSAYPAKIVIDGLEKP